MRCPRGDRQAAGAHVTEKNPPRIGRATARRQGGRKAAVARESREQQHSKPPPTLTDAQEERRFDASVGDAEERLQQATRAMAHVHAATQSVQRERSAKASTTALPWCVCVAAGSTTAALIRGLISMPQRCSVTAGDVHVDGAA